MKILKKSPIYLISKHIFKFFLFLTLLFAFGTKNSYAYNEQIKRYERIEYIMGTLFRIEVYSENKLIAESSINNAFKEIRKYDLIMSNYNPESELSKAIKYADKHPVKISGELYDVFKKSLYFSEITNGKFDITVGPVIKLWGFKSKDFKIPTKEQISKALEKTGYKNIILDSQNQSIFLKRSGMEIDFGAIGKGYAIDKAVEILKKEGIKSGIIDSLSNQYYIGTPPDSDFWKVGIRDPRNHEKIIKYLEIKDKSVSTSGDYEQFFIYKNKRYSHIIDLKTGFPVENNIISATVISENSADADAISTSLLLLNKKESELLLNKFPGVFFVKIYNRNGEFIFE